MQRILYFPLALIGFAALTTCSANPTPPDQCEVHVILMPAQIAAIVGDRDTIRALMTKTCTTRQPVTFTSSDTTIGRVLQLSDTTVEITSVKAGYAAIAAWISSPPILVATASLQVN